MENILSVRDLVKYYPGVKAVDGISFDVKKGQCFGLLGPNGAGKTTTIEIMETITSYDKGDILYKNGPLDSSFKEEIGIQFQSTALQEFLTVKETLTLFFSLYENPRPMDEIIELCRLEEILERDNRKLSGGQKQRMLLAIALINGPELLFLDEPTTGLDPHSRRLFWELIEDIKAAGKTVILTTHYMDEAEFLCDEIVIMNKGKIIERGIPETLLHKHFDASCLKLPENQLSGIDIGESILFENGMGKIDSENVETTLKKLIQKGVDLRGLVIHKPNLDDLFVKLTGGSLEEGGSRI